MGDQVVIIGRYLNVANLQKKRMIIPVVMLHTKNVMIPVIKPVPFKSFNIPLSENKLQILKIQNYRNNPALLFSETPSHTLYNPLENLLEVRKLNCWKHRNQSTKYTISGKTSSLSIKKRILQNSSPSKRLCCKKKNNMLHFPNTVLVQPLKRQENLHKISSKSIKLSRKCDLSQMKENQIRYENEPAVVPKIETPISNIISKPSTVSLQSQSFHDFTDTISTVSIQSMPSFKFENKKTFVNIENRKKLISRLASNHSQPIYNIDNSEYEINVLHYENDNLLEKNLSHFSQSHLESTNTNWSSTDNISSIKMQDAIEIPANKKSNNTVIESATENHHKYNSYEIIRDIKYSWEADNWMPSTQRKEYERKVTNMEWHSKKPYDCKIKYSWQVVGTSTQTSHTLLQDLLNDNNTEGKSSYKMCSIKYSWQVIGISTQASLHNCNDEDYWNGMLLTPNKYYNENNARCNNNERNTKLQDHLAKYSEKRLKRYLILNNQQTQTFAEKEVQANTYDYYAKYSWHNLIKRYL